MVSVWIMTPALAIWQNDFVAGFDTHQGKIAILNMDHVDTDRIIPARFLSRVSRLGYGELLFSDVRGDGFVLDTPEAAGASILVVGTNFGCGSSREHAVWALQQGGFAAVIARKDADSPGYSDIFRGNAANCGMLLIEIVAEDHARLTALGTGATITVDLPNQQIRFGSDVIQFDMNEATKQALVEGLDLIGTTLKYGAEIAAYESNQMAYVPSRVNG